MDLIKQVTEYLNLLDSETKEHSYRVAQMAYMNALQLKSQSIAMYCYALGLAHDLYEDTDLPHDTFKDEIFNNDILLLTRDREITYFDYIKKINSKRNESFAYIIKISDLIDHITNRDTLSISLRSRYTKAIKILCPELEGIDLDSESCIEGLNKNEEDN